ncbi:MAG: hypothetical protein J1E62_08595 [Lachnospiraceae bacterium]|nr:hypothetical protein [Lachnospiraceae bacterium]
MKKIVVAMYDREGYTSRLADYFCQHQKSLLDVRLFTSEESLQRFLKQQCVEVLVIGEQELDSFQQMESRIHRTVLLSEGQCVRENTGETVVFKYQSAESVLQTILTIIADDDRMSVPIQKKQVGRTSFIGVYAPFGGAGVSSFSWKLLQEYSIREKCLYIALELFDGLPSATIGKRMNNAWNIEETGGMSELIFFLRQHREKISVKLDSLVRHIDGMHCIAAVEDYRDLYDMTISDLLLLLEVLARETDYEKVVFDIGFLGDVTLELMKHLDTLYMPRAVTATHKKKLEAFTRLLHREGLNELSKQIQYVEVKGI